MPCRASKQGAFAGVQNASAFSGPAGWTRLLARNMRAAASAFVAGGSATPSATGSDASRKPTPLSPQQSTRTTKPEQGENHNDRLSQGVRLDGSTSSNT